MSDQEGRSTFEEHIASGCRCSNPRPARFIPQVSPRRDQADAGPAISARRRRLALSCATSPSTSSLSTAAAAPLHTATVPAASPQPCARTSAAQQPLHAAGLLHRPRPRPPPLPTTPSSPAPSPRHPRIAQKNWSRWRSSEPFSRSTLRRRLFPDAPQVLLRSLPVLSAPGSDRVPAVLRRRGHRHRRRAGARNGYQPLQRAHGHQVSQAVARIHVPAQEGQPATQRSALLGEVQAGGAYPFEPAE